MPLDLDAIRERNERRKSYRALTSPCPEADGYNDDVDALCDEVARLRTALKTLYESVMHHSGYWIPDLDMDIGMVIDGLKEADAALNQPQ